MARLQDTDRRRTARAVSDLPERESLWPFLLAAGLFAAAFALAEPAFGAPQGLQTQLAEAPARTAAAPAEGLDLSVELQPSEPTARDVGRPGAGPRAVALGRDMKLHGLYRLEIALYPDDRRFAGTGRRR